MGFKVFCDRENFHCEGGMSGRLIERFKRMGYTFDWGAVDFEDFTFSRWLKLVCMNREGEYDLLGDHV